MAEIKPFKALIYNQKKIADFSRVICPPYDIISKQTQKDFYNSSPYNIIRLLLNKDTKKDTPDNDRYSRPKKTLDDWQRRNILIHDEKECFYLHKHVFKVNGKSISRYGILGLLKLEKSVLGHEKTKAEPMKDRLRLIRKVKANLSPIFVLFSDKKKTIHKVFNAKFRQKTPFMKFIDYDNNSHYLWRIEDELNKEKIRAAIKKKHTFIADGHHRCSVGFQFASQMRKKHQNSNGKEPWNYIMSYFANTESKGLVIFPVHRIIKNLDKKTLKYMLDILGKYFKIEVIKKRSEFVAHFDKKKKERHCFGLYFRGAKRFYILRIKDKQIIKKFFPKHKKEFHNLDIFTLEELVIKKLLKIREKSEIDYIPDAYRAIEAVESQRGDAVFLVSPTKIEDVKRVALVREHMPAKSTYFYPKVLAGLTLHKF